MNEIENALHTFISGEVVLDGAGNTLRPDEPLISSGRVDSLGLLQILSFIEATYGVSLLQTGSPRDFETIQALARAVQKAQAHG